MNSNEAGRRTESKHAKIRRVGMNFFFHLKRLGVTKTEEKTENWRTLRVWGRLRLDLDSVVG